jgi:flagellar M-ring protein FliF
MDPLQSLSNTWSGLTSTQKISLGLLAVILVASIITAAALSTRVSYVVLYSNLDPKDGGAVVAKLSEMNVPYRLSAGGTTVEVAANRVDQARLDLASAGLPAGSKVDFGIFDKVSFGATERVQEINYRRALEGELSKTISAMKQVSFADVRIDQPEPSLFVEEEKPTVGAVVLSLLPGAKLSNAQIGSIVYLVSHSVAGLEPENVFVTDTDLRPLSDGSEFASGELSGISLRHFEHKRELEKAEAGKLQSVLDKAYGPGTTQVQVTLDMDFIQKDETTKQYVQPEGEGGGGRKISEQTLTEEYLPTGEGAGGSASGPSGAASNLPGGGGAPAGSAMTEEGAGYRQTQTTTNYVPPDETTTHEVSPPGDITRRSVAVLLDSEKVRDRAEVEELAKATLGIDEQEGDLVSVVSLKFDRTWQEEQKKAAQDAEKQAKKRDMMASVKQYGTWGFVAVLLVVFLLWTKKWVASAVSKISARPQAAAPGPAGAAGAGPAAPREGSHEAPGPLTLEERVDRSMEAVTNYAKTKPEAAALLLRSWLGEE